MNARGFGRSSIDYPRSAYYMAKVLLALFVGLFRKRSTPSHQPPDRPRASLPRPGGGDRRRERGVGAGGCMAMSVMLPIAAEGELQPTVQIVAVVVTGVLLLAVLELARRSPARRALRAAVDDGRCRPAPARRVDRPARLGVRSGRIADPANAFAAFGVAFVLLLHFSVANFAARRGDKDPRPGGRAARRAGALTARRGSQRKAPGGDASDGAPRDPGAGDAQSSARTTDQ